MGKNQSASNLPNIIKQDASGNITFVSGSTTLMSVSSSGAITTTGNVAGTASYASNAELLDGLDSTVFTLTSSFAAQTASFTAFTASVNSFTASQNITNSTFTLTSSFAAQTASFTAFTSSVNSFTASQLVLNGTYATTGSNTFAGIQTVNSNLVVTGSITAQTLVVQTITSSVDFVTGSTRFGSLSSNTHVFTGSMSVSGSGNFSGSLNLGGYLTGQGTNPGGLGGSRYVIDWLSGTMRIFSYGADSSTNGGFVLNSQRSDGTNSQNYLSIAASTGAATFTGSIGVGNVTPYSILSLPSGTGWNGGLSWNYTTANSASKRWWINTDQITYGDFRICVEQTQGGGTISSAGTLYERLYINSTGSVGIGTTTPSFQLDVFPGVANTTIRAGSYAIMQSVTTNQAMFGLNVAYATSIGTGWRYINTDYATAIRMYSGDIIFHLASSGTAGTQPATWDTTDAKMTIKNGGNVLIGTTTDSSYKLAVASGTQYLGAGFVVSNDFTSTIRQGASGVADFSGTTVTFDLASIFPRLTFTNRGLSVTLQLVAVPTYTITSSAFVVLGRTGNSNVWSNAILANININGVAVNSVSASGTVITVVYSTQISGTAYINVATIG